MSENLYTLPQGWEWKKLEDIAQTTSGGTPSRSTKAFWNGSIPWLKSGELNDGLIIKAEEFITDEGLNKSSAKIFPKGTLLIAMYGATAGKLGFLDFDSSTNQAVCAILNKQSMSDSKFIYYFLLGERAKIIKDSFGGAQPNISQTYIKNMDIPLPPLEEQRRIVGVLDGLFSKIDKSIALLDESIASASSLMPSALNEVFEELGEKWEKKKLEECTFFQNGYAFKSQDFSETQKTFQVIRIGNVLDLNKNPVYIDEQKELERFRLYENDIVISMTGTRQKQDYLFVSLIQKAKYYLNQRVGKITAKSNSVSKFIFYYLQSRHFREKIFEFETGTVNQGNISGKDIMNMLIPLPPLDIQTQTVAYLDALHLKADALKKAQEKKKEALLALKASLLESAFKGAL